MSKVWQWAGYIEGLCCHSGMFTPQQQACKWKAPRWLPQVLIQQQIHMLPSWVVSEFFLQVLRYPDMYTQVLPEHPLHKASMLGWVWRVYVYFYVCQRTSTVALCLAPLRQGLSQWPWTHSLLVWLVRELLGATCLPPHTHPATLQCIQAFIAMAGFLCDCQGFKFRFSCLHGKCSYPTGHLSSPTSRGKKCPLFSPLLWNDA